MSKVLPKKFSSINTIIDALPSWYSSNGIKYSLKLLHDAGWVVEDISDGYRTVAITFGSRFKPGEMSPEKQEYKQLQLAVDSDRRPTQILSFREVQKVVKVIWV